MDLRVRIWHFLGDCVAIIILFLVPSAKGPEVFTRLWAILIKQLYDHLLGLHTLQLNIHVNVAASGRVVDDRAVGVAGCFTVNQDWWLVSVSELGQSPLHEGIDTADVYWAVKKNKRAALVMVELTLQLILCGAQIVVPLGWEELKHTALYLSRELRLELVQTR